MSNPIILKRQTRFVYLQRLLKSKLVALSVLLIVIIVVIGLFAPQIAPHDPSRSNMDTTRIPPFWIKNSNLLYPLGTDTLGRDVLSQLLFGARVSLLIVAIVTLLSGILGTVIGAVAGYYGGAPDQFIMYIIDIQLAFPFILLAMALATVLGPGIRNLVIALIVSEWVIYARVARGLAISHREQGFVEASRSMGANNIFILKNHILMNIKTDITILMNVNAAKIILSEASLSFLGLGVNLSTPTWGTMISNGRDYIFTEPWLTLLPGIAIVLAVLSLNILGNSLRNELDPHRTTM